MDDAALAWLGAVRAVPTVLTPARVRADPCFAGLRGAARFEDVLRGR